MSDNNLVPRALFPGFGGEKRSGDEVGQTMNIYAILKFLRMKKMIVAVNAIYAIA